MIVDIIAFVSGLALGGIPSVATFIMLKRGVFADVVMGNIEAPKVVDGGQLHYEMPKLPKHVDIYSLAKAVVKNAELHPEQWELIPEGRAISHNGRTMFGVRNKEANIFCLRNHLTFSKATDIWLNDVQIKEGVFKHVVEGVTAAKNNMHMRELMGRLQRKPQILLTSEKYISEKDMKLLSAELKNIKDASIVDFAAKKKEAAGKTIDPFAPMPWDDAIYKTGKALASMAHVSKK